LLSELPTLRHAMKERASEPEHDIAIGAIAQAEASAAEGDKTKAVSFLSKAGKWTLDVAQSIGVPVAAALLESAMGLKP
jgi:hypothetical protein